VCVCACVVRVLTQHLLRTFQLAIFKKAMGENPESEDLLFGYLNTSAQILEYVAHALPQLSSPWCSLCVCRAIDKTEERK